MLSLYQMNSNDQIVALWKVEKGNVVLGIGGTQFLALLLDCCCLCPEVNVSYKLDCCTVVGSKY